ncbi:MAG: DUF167 family protein [Gammaproteobacteria bacterium]
MTDAGWYRWQGENLILRVRIQPRAAKDEIAGLYGDRLKVRITAPPTDGRANEHLRAFLAKQFGVPKTRITLLSGAGSRDKRLRIKNPQRIPET